MPVANTQPQGLETQRTGRPSRRYLPHIVVALNCILVYAFYRDWMQVEPRLDSSSFLFGNRARELLFTAYSQYIVMDIAIFLLWIGEKKLPQHRSSILWMALGAMGLAFLAFQLNFWARLIVT
jgi:hypothetical protein